MPLVQLPARSSARRSSARRAQLLRIRTLRWLIAVDDGDGVRGRRLQRVAARLPRARQGHDARRRDRRCCRSRCSARSPASSSVAGSPIGCASDAVAGRLWTIAIGMVCAIPCTVARASSCRPGPVLYVGGHRELLLLPWYHAPMAATVDDLAPPDAGGRRAGPRDLHDAPVRHRVVVVGGRHRLGATRRSTRRCGSRPARSSSPRSRWSMAIPSFARDV